MLYQIGGQNIFVTYVSAEDGRMVKRDTGNYIEEYSNISVGNVKDEYMRIPNLESYEITTERNLQDN